MAGPGTKKQDWRPRKKAALWVLGLAIDDRALVEVADIGEAAKTLFRAVVDAALAQPGVWRPLVTVEEDAHDSWVRVGLRRRVMNASLYWTDRRDFQVTPADREDHRRLEAELERLIRGR